MMNFFPAAYDDELFYSIISRYKQMSGITSKTAFAKDLFGKVGRPQSLFLPKNINCVISNLPMNSKLTAEDFILENSLFKFFTAFLSKTKSEDVYKCMVDGESDNAERKMGMVGSKVKINKTLNFCPVCLKEDMECLGESYWRRLQQVPGALYCLKHSTKLIESNVITTDTKLDYVCPDNDSCKVLRSEQSETNNYKNLNIKYVENSSLLLSNSVEREELKFIIDFYIDRLRERGLASKGGSIYVNELQSEFVNFYTHEYLKMMKSDIDLDTETNWVRMFVRNNNKNRSPLRHLLMLQFLNIEITELFNASCVLGKKTFAIKSTPKLDRDDMRQKWLEIVESNLKASRPELKKIGKGLYTWMYRHDWEWFNKVTPKKTKRKVRKEIIDWGARDNEYLILVRKVIEQILTDDGKPVRVTRASIRRMLVETREINNKKLVKTNSYINENIEDIDNFRLRKIRWAIKEMIKLNIKITPYKIQLFAGFGGNDKYIKKMIEDCLDESNPENIYC
jgi:hypothetical protein